MNSPPPQKNIKAPEAPSLNFSFAVEDNTFKNLSSLIPKKKYNEKKNKKKRLKIIKNVKHESNRKY